MTQSRIERSYPPGGRFSLQTLLDVKGHIEDQLQTELAALVRKCHGLRTYMELLRGRASQAARFTAPPPGEPVDVGSAQVSLAYAAHLLRLAEATEEELILTEEEARDKRLAVQGAMQERKALERLKEDEAARERRRYARIEARQLDEIAMVRFELKTRQEGR